MEAYLKAAISKVQKRTVNMKKRVFTSEVEFINRDCRHAQDMLSSLKLHNSVRALLVKYSVAALSATDHISLLQGVFSPAIAANVRHAWVSVRPSVHDLRMRGIKGSDAVAVTAICEFRN